MSSEGADSSSSSLSIGEKIFFGSQSDDSSYESNRNHLSQESSIASDFDPEEPWYLNRFVQKHIIGHYGVVQSLAYSVCKFMEYEHGYEVEAPLCILLLGPSGKKHLVKTIAEAFSVEIVYIDCKEYKTEDAANRLHDKLKDTLEVPHRHIPDHVLFENYEELHPSAQSLISKASHTGSLPDLNGLHTDLTFTIFFFTSNVASNVALESTARRLSYRSKKRMQKRFLSTLSSADIKPKVDMSHVLEKLSKDKILKVIDMFIAQDEICQSLALNFSSHRKEVICHEWLHANHRNCIVA